MHSFFYYEFFTQIHEYEKIDIFVIPHEYLSLHYFHDIQAQKFPKLPGLQVSPSSLMDPDVANLLNNATTSHYVQILMTFLPWGSLFKVNI